ncbi:unnamed protein product [Lathyrus sativus]|nr:unnamed protein product [Lathyrus sativus]
MQPYYENEIPNNTLYQQPQLTIDDSASSILSTPQLTLTPNHIHHPILQHYHHHSHSPQHRQQYQHFYQHKYQPSQQQQETYSLGDTDTNVNGYIECEEGSTARLSFWKAFNNTVKYDATAKQQEENQNETCLVSDNNFGELEAVYKNELGRNQDDLKRFARKKMRKKKVVKEELEMMNSFFKRLVKRVVNHQEVLQNKLLEVIDRIERKRIEREENWRREENELYEREAIVKARERDLAKRRESSIVSSIEKITGRKFFFVSESTHQN